MADELAIPVQLRTYSASFLESCHHVMRTFVSFSNLPNQPRPETGSSGRHACASPAWRIELSGVACLNTLSIGLSASFGSHRLTDFATYQSRPIIYLLILLTFSHSPNWNHRLLPIRSKEPGKLQVGFHASDFLPCGRFMAHENTKHGTWKMEDWIRIIPKSQLPLANFKPFHHLTTLPPDLLEHQFPHGHEPRRCAGLPVSCFLPFVSTTVL